MNFVVAAKKRFDEIMRQMTDSEEEFNESDEKLEKNCKQVPIIQQGGNRTFNVINLNRGAGCSDSYALSKKREARITNSNTRSVSYPVETETQIPSNKMSGKRVPGNSSPSLEVRSFPPIMQSRVEPQPSFPVSDMRSPYSQSTPIGYYRTEMPGSSQSVRLWILNSNSHPQSF